VAGPHVLAFAAHHPERVRAATVVVGAAPLDEQDLVALIGLNRAAWYAAREGWDAVLALLAPEREKALADPLARFRAVMDAAPAADKQVMDDPMWQSVFVESVTEALRPGAEGWADESMAMNLPWDFDPSDVRCSITWWHGEHDANAPITAVRRLLQRMDGADLRVWREAGHLEPYHRYETILEELLTR
jgi:pimeloyl-ACP methyl ester carboxylesterase